MEPGEIDYPKENPNPNRIVELSITNPDSVEYELRSVYEAPKSTNCEYVVNVLEGATAGFGVSLPTTFVHGVDGIDRAQVVIDKYMPGRCGWKFSRLVLVVLKGGKKSLGHTILDNPSSVSFFGARYREGLLKDKRATNESDVILECNLSLIDRWRKRGGNGLPCVVNGVWGGVGKVLTDTTSDIHVRMRDTDSPIHVLERRH